MRRPRRSIALRYGVAVAVAALALFLTTQYAVMLGRSMFLLFTAAVMLSAWYGGFGPGVVTTIVGVLVSAFYLLPPAGSVAVRDPYDILELTIFLGVGVLISMLNGAHHRFADEIHRLNGELYQRVVERTKELEEANQALRVEIAEHQKAERQFAASNAELERFAYVASHDLKEPLRMVTSYTQLLARRYKDRLDADADEFIRYAVDGATRMQQLIDDLLAYSRVGARNKDIRAVDCNVVLNRVLLNLAAAIAESEATVTHDPLPTVTGDAIQLMQLFQNLIGNAVKFRGERAPRVHVGVARQHGAQDDWLFSVSDNGIGIEAQYAERIFMMFQRLHTREEYAGTGIGLAICKKIVEGHGGRIWVKSQLGRGATFYFTLPISSGDRQDGDAKGIVWGGMADSETHR